MVYFHQITLFILASFLFPFFSSLSFAAQNVTIYVNESHPPYLYTKNGKADGIYIDILKKIDEKMPGYNFKFAPVPWKRAKFMMESGQGFAFVPPYFHGHDWPYVWPYSLPIMIEAVALICHPEILKKKRLLWPQSYLGLSIGNNSGFDGFGGPKFRELVMENKIFLKERAKHTRENILKLLAKRFDCYMVNRGSYARKKL